MDDRDRFIAELYGPARRIGQETGASWETILAQAAQETGWGRKVLPGTNNIFNIKADRGWHGRSEIFRVWEVENGRKVWRDESFRVYDSVDEALRDRVDFLRSNPCYSKAGLFDQGTLGNLEREAEALQRAGFATDPDYSKKLIELFNGPTMQRALAHARSLPDPGVETSVATHMAERVQVGRHGYEVASLQAQLASLGYKDARGEALRVDGAFGRRTREALKAFQTAHGLEAVGYVGPKTEAALRYARAHGPVPVDPAHPDHALHRQVSRAVDVMERVLGRTPDENSERLKAALLPVAKEAGLTRVDHVVLSVATSTAPAGEQVFVVQGRIDDPTHRRARMSTQQAVDTPVQASWAALERIDAQSRASQAHGRAQAHRDPLPPGDTTTDAYLQQRPHAAQLARHEHHDGLRRGLAP